MQENNIVLLIITNNVTLYLANSSRVILAHTLTMLAKNATFIHLIVEVVNAVTRLSQEGS